MRNLSLFFLLIVSYFSFSQDKPIVVVELFTSEGCSSCPPADRLLSRIIDKDDQSVEVLGLSFHVNYWDYLGWKDPYARKAYSTRQRVYGRKFKARSIYTPQMIVNGKHEFVGSNEAMFDQILAVEKERDLNFNLELTDLKLLESALEITVRALDIERSILNVAIVERELSQQVKRGENRGRTLSHDNVVRAYEFRQFDGQPNRFSINLPADLSVENSSLIIYAQKEENWYVNAAKKIDLINLE